MNTKPAFKAFNFDAAKKMPDVDVLTKTVEKVAQATNTPKLVYPSDTAKSAAERVPEVAPVEPQTKFKRFTVELPLYLIDDIDTRARGKTRRYIAMKALKDAGFFVDEKDLKEDFRGGRR